MEEWNMHNVYEIIKSKLEELHLLGIWHNDIRRGTLSVSGNFQSLHHKFGKHDQDGLIMNWNCSIYRCSYILLSSEKASNKGLLGIMII